MAIGVNAVISKAYFLVFYILDICHINCPRVMPYHLADIELILNYVMA